ncbi:2'-5' RNA ligase family protein [Nocardia sp. NPDC059180]|uniref:2'-5' RNA ligase family protein n=1 Tax=Nocardia sp. NPDC059180 TaxID=3346761 RepID=UPI0036BBE590
MRDFAGLLGVETTTVNNWRVGLSSVKPRAGTQSILDTTLVQRTSSEDRERFEQIVAEGEAAWRKRNRPQRNPLVGGSTDSDADDREELLTVLNRVQKLSRSVDPHVVNQMGSGTRGAIEGYETSEPAELLPWLRKQRAWLESLIDECGDPRQRIRLFEIAGQTSGLLGYIAVGCGSFTVARAYCLESYQLGCYAGDTNLMAWARGIQSFCEYYAGRYEDALRFAEAGLVDAAGGSQSVRLAINGVARAKGKLGDAEGSVSELRLRQGQDGPLGHYWFLTFVHATDLHFAATARQRTLDAQHFAVTPIDGLHLTLDRIAAHGGSTAQQRARIVTTAEDVCARLKPFVLAVDRLANIRAAIGFLVAPDERVHELRDALRGVTMSVLPDAPVKNSTAAPHVTIAYPIYEGLTTEAIAAVEANETPLDHVSVTVSEVRMVMLERRGHGYQWETVARIPLTGV